MSFIQNLFTSRDNNANASTYVGQQGRIWWDPLTNSLYYSDGSTPGGIPVGSGGNPFNQVLNTNSNVTFNNLTLTGNLNLSNTTTANLGNFTISDQTLAGTIAARNVNIETYQGSADVNILGGFNIHSSNLAAPPDFAVDNQGRVTMRVPTPESVTGSINIIGSPDGSEQAPQNFGVLLHQTGQQSVPSRIYNDGVANYAAYIGRRYNGTAAAPTVVTSGQIISRIGATPYIDGTENWPAVSTSRIDFIATETQSNIAQGSKIQMWATPAGSNAIALVADFGLGGINLTGNLLPTVDNIYTLGNINQRWKGGYFGNAGIYIQDATLGTTGSISLNNGILLVDSNISSIRVGNTSLTQSGISTSNAASNIQIGLAGDTGYTYLRNAGLKFADSTIQTTAAIPLSYLAAANGVATLGADSKVIPSQLPAGAVFFKGTWDASTNTPTLVNGTGTAGWEYQCVVSGTVNFGAGPIAFTAGDFVIYNGALWQRIPGSGSGVTSFNTRTGVVTLTSSDVTTALTTGALTNDKLQNNAITINTGSGLAGGAVANLGGTVTLTANVRDITAGTGVTVTPSSGNYTIAIGQPVGNASSVSFLSVVSNSTIQAVGNITGGNLSTSNTVSAGGNIIGNNVTSNTFITANNVNATGNINFTGANVSLGAVGNVRVTGGTNGQFLTTNGSGTLSWSNVTAANITGTIANANYAAYAGNVTIAGQGNITSLGTLTGLTSGGVVNLTTASNVALGSNANVHITGGTANYALITDGAGALSWSDIAGISGSTAQTVATWVPTLTATGGGTFTYSVQTGYYIKSGRSVSCYFTVTITGVTGVSGTVRVSNLPVTSINQTNAGGGALDNYSFASLPSHVTGLVAANSTYMALYWHDRAGSTNTMDLMTTANLGTSATLIGRITYISAT